MLKQIIIATGNKHKVEEIKNFYQTNYAEKFDLSIELAPQELTVVENGKTYFENAYLKAKAYFDQFKMPTLADDSGLTIHSLPNILGVESSRFMEGSDYAVRNQKIIELLKNEEDRTAYFSCVLCLYKGPAEVFFFEGVMHGHIAHVPLGEQGFGYDPIFVPKELKTGETLAENLNFKNQSSHRVKALQKFFQLAQTGV